MTTEQLELSLGAHYDSNSPCFGCMKDGFAVGRSSYQTIYLLITRQSNEPPYRRSEPYCFTCALKAIEKMRLDLYESQKEQYIKERGGGANF